MLHVDKNILRVGIRNKPLYINLQRTFIENKIYSPFSKKNDCVPVCQLYGGTFLSPTCKIKMMSKCQLVMSTCQHYFDDMRLIYVNSRLIYIYMQHYYVNMYHD